MNFFEHQEKARRVSLRLFVLFILAVLGVVIAVDVVVLSIMGLVDGETFTKSISLKGNSHLIFVAASSSLLTLAFIGCASLYRILSLRSGGTKIAQQMGGVEVPRGTLDFTLKRLRNVVEEVAIASGTPVPGVYVIENEPGINAFAAGFSPNNAVVAVTRGALQQLNREELQAVIAHEFSHICNGDMRLNIRLIGVLFGIMALSIVGQYMMRVVGRGNRNSGRATAVIVAFAFAIMMIGFVGALFGRIIKAGISRQREFLADASAVQFTRQTHGLAGALKKIAGVPTGSRLANKAAAEEVSHMLFGQGFSSIFATHPPLLKRIQRLDPSFDADMLKTLKTRWAQTPPDGLQEDIALGFAEDRESGSPEQPLSSQ